MKSDRQSSRSPYLALLALAPWTVPQGTTFGPRNTISTTSKSAQSVHACDLDDDGDIDALTASGGDDTVAWFRNENGLGAFGPPLVISAQASGARAAIGADLDGDGDLDVASASEYDDTVSWYRNFGGGTFALAENVTTSADGAYSVFAADLDADGDLDLLAASRLDDEVAWFRNTDGTGAFALGQYLSKSAQGALCVSAADMDGDGDVDALSTAEYDDRVSWYRNQDGAGTFTGQITVGIGSEFNGARFVTASDVDGDGDQDVLASANLGDTVTWVENLSGVGGFAGPAHLSTVADGARGLAAADLDGDGDQDVLAATHNDDRVAWFDNTDGLGTFQEATIDTGTDGAQSVATADLDGDGDLDVLTASSQDNSVSWHENLRIDQPNLKTVPGALAQQPGVLVATGKKLAGIQAVSVDGIAGTVVAATNDALTYAPAPGSLGLGALVVSGADGTGTAVQPMYPTLEITAAGLGGVLSAQLENGEQGVYSLAFATSALPQPVSITSPPTWYGLMLDLSAHFTPLTAGSIPPSGSVSVAFPIPNNPGLSGLTLYIQAWCQQGLFGPPFATYSFTNLGQVTL